MKILRRTASSGSCISRSLELVQRGGCDRADPNKQQAQRNRGEHICSDINPLTVAHEVERLNAERRESRIAAANPDHHELAHCAAYQKSPVRTCKRRKESD